MGPLGSPSPAIRVGTAFAFSTLVALSFTFIDSGAQSPPPSPSDVYVGKNVDVVGPFGTGPNPVWVDSPQYPGDVTKRYPLFLGDPDKKQQNEPSCDVSPTNPLIIFCGMNDYRGVDRPDVIGEPWVGASFSLDGGLNWKSYLHPGFKPKDPAAPVPFNALGFETAADPIVRIVPGLALYNFITFNRDGNGALFLSRWYERNTEGGFPYEWKDSIQLARGTGSPGEPGRFLDKPVMTVSLTPGTGTYDFDTGIPTAPGQTLIQKVPAGTVHVAYAVFTGNDKQDGTKIVYLRSLNYGDSWSPETVLSEAASINQAADIAVDPVTNRVVATWRRFANGTKQPDAIMFALSTDNGRSFGPPTVLSTICPFTQNTTSASFRTTTHPFVTFDGTAFHAIWADRGRQQGQCSTTGFSRIVLSSLQSNGKWSSSRQVDSTSPVGHQFQPGIVVSGKRLLVTWLDTRNDHRVDASYPDPAPDPYVNDFLFAGKTPPKVRRRAADIYAAQAPTGSSPAFGAGVQVSRYLFGIYPGRPPQQLERNKVNARMFQSGKVPFLGDYIAAAAARWVPKDPIANPGEWVSSAGFAGAQPVFHLAWTDNRLVRGDVSAALNDAGSTVYTPPPLASLGVIDPTTERAICTPSTAGTRDQSVFAAGIYPALLIGSSSAAKPTAEGLVRAYTIFLQNRTALDRTAANGTALSVRISAVSGGTASFDSATANTRLDNVEIARRSTIARTVFVASEAPRPVARIDVFEGAALVATTWINGNAYAAPINDPLDPNQRIPDDQIAQVEVHTPEILYRSTSIGVPAIDDPAIDDPAIDDPAIDDPAIDDPAIDDPAIDDPAIDDPAIDDPAIDDPAIDDPAIDDPAIDDPAIDDAAIASSSLNDPDTSTGSSSPGQKLTQVTWKIALDGNTTTSMSSKVFLKADADVVAALNASRHQLIVSRRYRTHDIRSDAGGACVPVRVSNYQVIANVVNPLITNQATPPDLVNPPMHEPSFTVPPGGAVYLTLRVWGDVPGFNPDRLGVIVSSQSGNANGEIPDDTDLLPIMTVPANQTVEATGPSGATVTFNAGALDAQDAPLPTTCTAGAERVGTTAMFSVTVPLGTTTVACSATDADNRTATATFAISVVDTTPPVLPGIADIQAEATSASGAVITVVPPAGADLVSGPVPSSCAPAGPGFAIGTTTVVCTAVDAAGNQGTTSFAVVVRDTTAPIVTVPSALIIEATGAAGAVVTYSAAATDGVSGGVTTTCTPPSGSTFPVGTTLVTCTATDGVNVSQATFTVSIADSTAPAITAPSVVAEATGPAGAVVTYTVTALDLVVGPVTPSCAPASATQFAMGTTTVSCTAGDGVNIAQTSFAVTVRDTTPPALPTVPDITVEATSASGAIVTIESTTGTDLVSGQVPASCEPGGPGFALGTTSVVCTAIDGAGNQGTTGFAVIVRDTIAPAVTVPAGVVVEATSVAGAVVTFASTATDAVAGAITPICTPPSGAMFGVGITPVTCTASDGVNIGEAGFTVTVRDTAAPVITVPAAIVAEASGPSGAVVNYVSTAIDGILGNVPVTCSPASGATFPFGATPVTCSASDGANIAQATFTVTVLDTTAPAIAVPSNVVTEATGPAGAAVTYVATATDLVTVSVTPSCAPASGTTFGIGSTVVACTASDGTNTAQASFSVTVRDTTPPLIVGTPANIGGIFGASGAVVLYTAPTATDLVAGSVPVACLPASGSTFPIGTTTVRCGARDGALPVNNTAETTFTVTVTRDATAPTVVSSVSPTLLWPPDGLMVPIMLSGTATDAQSGLARIEWDVEDEYNLVEPDGALNIPNAPSSHAFSFELILHRSRNGNDKNGRHYTITVTAVDRAGNRVTSKPLLVNVHDQGSK